MNQTLAKLAWHNLFRNRKRNALSLIAVVLGYLGMCVFFDYVAWAEKWMSTLSVYVNHNGHVNVYKEGALEAFFTKPRRYVISPELQKQVIEMAQSDPRVEYVGRYLKGMGLVNRKSASTAFVAYGVDLSIEDKLLSHPMVKSWAQEFVNQQYRGNLWGHEGVTSPVAVTSRMAQLLSYPFPQAVQPAVRVAGGTAMAAGTAVQAPAPTVQSNEIQLISQSYEGALSAQDANIVSQFSTGQALSEDTAMMTSLETLQKLYDTEGVSSIAIYLKDRADLGAFYKDLGRKFEAQGIPLKALPFYDERISPFYVGVTQFIYSAAVFFLLLVSSVVIISLANTISMTVVERTREIGTLRSIGYLPSHVNRLFLFEGVLLLSLGLAIGVAANHLVSYLVNNHTNLRFAPPGIAGDAQFLVITNPTVSASLAAVFMLLGTVAIRRVVKRRTSLPVAVLFHGNTSGSSS